MYTDKKTNRKSGTVRLQASTEVLECFLCVKKDRQYRWQVGNMLHIENKWTATPSRVVGSEDIDTTEHLLSSQNSVHC